MTNKPDLTKVWAENADPTDIKNPDLDEAGKFQKGWLSEIPPHTWFNYIQNNFSAALAHFNEYGIAQWDTDTVYPVGGWARSTVDNEVYVALAAQSGNEPSASPAQWRKIGQSKMVRYLAGGVYIPPAGVKSLKIIATGGGAGSGGVIGGAGGTAACSGAGSAGGTTIKQTSTIDASYTIVIGAGGNAGLNGTAGGAGGATTVTSSSVSLTANGGTPGVGQTASASTLTLDGKAGGTSSGGDINLVGGATGMGGTGGGQSKTAGAGGASYWGGGGAGLVNEAGAPGVNFGSGGGAVSTNPGAGSFPGGAGADGVVIIEETY